MKKIVLIILVILGIFLTSCKSDEIENQLSENTTVKVGQIGFNIDLGLIESKINKTLNINRAEVTLTKGSEIIKTGELSVNNESNNASGKFDNLQPGTWTAKISLHKDNEELAFGIGDIQVISETTVMANIQNFTVGEETINISNSTRVIELNKNGNFEFILDNLIGESVYFVFTNEKSYTGDLGNSILSPSIVKNINENKSLLSKNLNSISPTVTKSNERGSKKIDELNKKIEKDLANLKSYSSLNSRNIIGPEKTEYSLGQSQTFFDDYGGTVNTKLRKKQSAHGQTLYIWVENSSWIGGTKASILNQEMVDIFADRFLKNGDNNDIYEWVTAIVGEPWGQVPNGYENVLIPDNKEIHILMCDIDNDNSIDGGCLGYFFSRDNISKKVQPYSNEKLMFVIDSVLFATDDSKLNSNSSNKKWEITDYWPSELVSTLGHEFQHMIHFYQKTVRYIDTVGQLKYTDVWLNELASLAIEDIISQKIMSNGPRGIDYDDMTAGGTGIKLGRLPEYNLDNDIPITAWGGYDKSKGVLPSYAINYAFGAYLVRNFGGPEFIKNIVQNNKFSTDAVDEVLKPYGLTFKEALRKFGTANLLSDMTDNQVGNKFNKGNAFSYNLGSMTYNLGSINLFNYINQPKIYDNLPSKLYNTSNTYYNGGQNLYGTNKWTIEGLDPNVKMTVVIKK